MKHQEIYWEMEVLSFSARIIFQFHTEGGNVCFIIGQIVRYGSIPPPRYVSLCMHPYWIPVTFIIWDHKKNPSVFFYSYCINIVKRVGNCLPALLMCLSLSKSNTIFRTGRTPPPPRNKQTKTNYYHLYLQVATSWSLLQCVAKLFTYMLTITTWRFSVLAAVFISFWLTTSLHSNHFPLPTQTWLSLAFWPSLVIFPYSSQKSFWPMLCLSLGIYTWVHLVIVPLTVKGGVGGGSSAGGSWGYCFPVACACC